MYRHRPYSLTYVGMARYSYTYRLAIRQKGYRLLRNRPSSRQHSVDERPGVLSDACEDKFPVSAAVLTGDLFTFSLTGRASR